tara:strand:+ start:1236 stop:1931 length:696 start_codon:yes stop_codon:yes gene_type:complete
VRLLYVPDLREGCFELPEDEVRHAIKVLRARVGDSFQLIDGMGGSADAVIVEIGKRNCVVEVESVSRHDRPNPQLTMLVCPTKQTERFEWFLEKAVEIGVDRVIPVWSIRSERRVEKHQRWKKVIVSAMKQSGRSWLPKLEDACAFEEGIKAVDSNIFIAHCMESEKVHVLKAIPSGQDACIAIGPEGDFTKEEVDFALEKGAVEISLGEGRLRTETAAIVATTYFRAIQQ